MLCYSVSADSLGQCVVLYNHQGWVVSSIFADFHVCYFRACALDTLLTNCYDNNGVLLDTCQ